MKKLILLLAVALLAGCKPQDIITSDVQREQMYIDASNHMAVVLRGGTYYYVLFNAYNNEYTFKEVPFFRVGYIEKLKHAKIYTNGN